MLNRASSTSLASWLGRRVPEWKRLVTLVGEQRDSGREPVSEVLELVQRFRALGRDLAMARAVLPGSALTRQLEGLFVEVHDNVYRQPSRFWRGLLELFRDQIPEVVHELRGNIIFTISLFVGTTVLGWTMVSLAPELVGLFASESMIDRVQRGELWTDDLLNVVPSSVLSVQLMTNNIMVSLMAFSLGALYGLGTLYIMALNGLMLGGIFAFTHEYGLSERLLEFIFAHGVVELSVICLSGAAGIELGEALIRPGLKSRMVAFQEAVVNAGKLLPLVAIFLVFAGLIEGYISPDPRYSMVSKVVVGLSTGTLLWLTLTGQIWTAFGRRSRRAR